ncbi:MAG TPA: LacI family DNA-binding transcriptional regulator [Microbacterium sp.]|nr:LacI family DNA-binding transcriptional regulator [Microbacterium sp.]
MGGADLSFPGTDGRHRGRPAGREGRGSVSASQALPSRTRSRMPTAATAVSTQAGEYGVATLEDVARAAGVSPMTVSRVINGQPHVRPATREKVLDAIGRLNYQANSVARSLRRGRTGTIGLAVPEVDRSFFGEAAAHVVARAAEHGYRVAIEQTAATRRQELDAIELSRRLMYDGLILAVVELEQSDAAQLATGYPIVVLGDRVFDAPIGHITIPNMDAADAAVSHLLAQGCRSIAYIGGDSDRINVQSLRAKGYFRALERANLRSEPRRVVSPTGLDMRSGYEAAVRLISEGIEFDGIFCINDVVAIGALHALYERGIAVPDQVKVIGFDNITESQFSNPSLSTVDIGLGPMAVQAVDMLIEQINGLREQREVAGPFRVIGRSSTG